MKYTLTELEKVIFNESGADAWEYCHNLSEELQQQKCKKLESDKEHNKVCPKCRTIDRILGKSNRVAYPYSCEI